MECSAVSRRCVLFLNGYEPLSPAKSCQRLVREFQRAARTWNITTDLSEPRLSSDGLVVSLAVNTTGSNWSVETDFRLLHWGDMVIADFRRPHWRRLLGGAAAIADFVTTGTLWRYFRTNWRYGAFFCYPIILVAVFVYLALLVGTAAARVLPFPAAVLPLVSLVVFLALTIWPGRPLFFTYLLDDWMFARDYARGRRQGLEARLDRFARELVAAMRDSDADEVLFAGHSLGAALKLDIVARALKLDPDLTRKRRLVLLSTGSSLLKIALHPAAAGLRAAVDTVASEAGIDWVEYQSVVDIINFYKTDPVAAMGLPPRGKPLVRTVRIRAMLEETAYRRFRMDFFRLHRQLVMGNDRRHFYDFFMICCGPLPLWRRVHDPDFAVRAFAPDGAFGMTDAAGREQRGEGSRP